MIQNENTDLEFKQIKTYKKLSKKQKQKIETFFKSIIYFECRGVVYDLKTTKFEIKSFTNKYWKPRHVGKKTNYALYVNGEKILAKELFVLIYKCTVCSCENTIKNYSRLMPKLFKSTILYCRHCILKYDITMKYVRSTALTNKSLGTKFAKAKVHKEKQAFENMPNWWKDDYWKTHFTEDEFWKNIEIFGVTTISGFNVNEIETYIPYFPCTNSMQYTSKIQVAGKLYAITDVKCICKKCGKQFSFHWSKQELKTRKTKNICRNCIEYYLTNEVWQVQEYVNCKGNKITYQSGVEKDFIDFCNENNIEIIDGPVIPYFWNGKNRSYHVDFFIPKLGKMIEIKSMHKFLLEDIASGKFLAKCDAANKEVANEKFMSFEVIYDYDMTDSWKKDFIRQYNINLN